MATKITYTQQGDYLLPDLKLPEQPKIEIGIWDKRHLRYIKQYRPILYTNLLTKCELTNHLVDIDEEATKMFNELVNQIAKQEGVTEKLKADSQMLWVRRMNSIRNEVTKRHPIKFCVNNNPSSNNKTADCCVIRLSDLPRVNFSFLSAECYARLA